MVSVPYTWITRIYTNLNDPLAVVSHLGVDDDIEFHSLMLHDVFQSLKIDPQIISVENLEFPD